MFFKSQDTSWVRGREVAWQACSCCRSLKRSSDMSVPPAPGMATWQCLEGNTSSHPAFAGDPRRDNWHRSLQRGPLCALQKGLGMQGCALCSQGWHQQEPEGVRGLAQPVSARAGLCWHARHEAGKRPAQASWGACGGEQRFSTFPACLHSASLETQTQFAGETKHRPLLAARV